MCQYYHTIAKPGEGIYREKGSKFIARAFAAPNEDAVQQQLQAARKEHPKARHHCYAFRLGESGAHERVNDDGEPSGTAGKPILGQLVKHDLTFSMVVVTRYFGGTRLGVAGLINAYRSAASDAIGDARIDRHLIGEVYIFRTDYALGATLAEIAGAFKCELIGQEFMADVTSRFRVPVPGAQDRVLGLLKKMTNLDFHTIREYAQWVEVKKEG